MRISDWSSDVCSSDLVPVAGGGDLQTDRLPLAGEAGGHRDRRVPAQVGEHRERRGHGATRRWPLGCEGGHGGGGREEHVHLLEEGRCVEGQLLARSDRTGELRHRVGLSLRSEEHTSELQSLMRISYAVFCLKKKKGRTSTRQHRRNQRY